MSVMFASRRISTAKAPLKQSSEIAKRDMSNKKKVIRSGSIDDPGQIRKVKELSNDGKVQVTTAWNLDIDGTSFRISFSRDNLHVWINGRAVETTSFISDKGYDVDLFFSIAGAEGHIYSDVEKHEMMNYLLINGEIKGQDYQVETPQS